MEIVNVHEAKTHLSRLLEGVKNGESFIIARAGKPVAKLEAIDPPEPLIKQRMGFLRGQFVVPDDFDRLGAAEIEAMFGLNNEPTA